MVQMAWTEDSDGNNGREKLVGENGFLTKMGIIDYSGGYVIHLSSGVAGFTAAYWVSNKIFVCFD